MKESELQALIAYRLERATKVVLDANILLDHLADDPQVILPGQGEGNGHRIGLV
jgi:hypothetical protein